MKLAAAESAVRHAGLKPKPVGHKSVTGPYNQVTTTSPAGGTKVPKGSQVILNYNVKAGPRTLPDVSNMTVQDAIAKLNQAGWNNVTTNPSLVPSLKIKKGYVVSTDPSAGKTIPLTAPISLNVSGGGVAVPPLAGLTLRDARYRLTQLGLINQVFRQPGPPGTIPGTVWRSSPSRGKAVLPGSTVALYVEPGSTSSPTPPPSSSSSPSPSPSPSPSDTSTPPPQ
jgi:serine/threonine-protein kinase